MRTFSIILIAFFVIAACYAILPEISEEVQPNDTIVLACGINCTTGTCAGCCVAHHYTTGYCGIVGTVVCICK
ncbi:unnamed protein product, partial [Mesorhabditis belari]|uniref:Uncharacterized protein n=1 Tax=Mesorhabditis belari TaxID=2138241 RepID=A0AAF3J3X7_9BILA